MTSQIPPFSPQHLAYWIFPLLASIIFLYKHLLPKPIPGIPYNKTSATRLLGDLPELLKWRKETGEMWSYIRNCGLELNSPIFQMFISSSIGKPWVVISDFREAVDIQLNRQGEFDRSGFLADVFGPLLPGNHVWMPSNATFRAHRSLIRDTMSPAFLNAVVAPAIHSSIRDLLVLWKHKARLCQGRPFEADKDIIRGVVDVILLATFGTQTDLSKSQANHLANHEKINLPSDIEEPANLPSAPESEIYTHLRILVDSLQIGMSSPIPRQHMNFALTFYPSLVKARKYTDNMMTEVLESAWKKFSTSSDREDQVVCAADLLIQREAQMARKQNRKAMYDTQVIRDELFGFFLAGHETTSTTICWAVKHLTRYQDVQEKLRSALRAAHKRATDENRLPTAQEIVQVDVPYLDAFIEENHRLGTAIPTVIRRATRDAVVLGCTIPKGTDVFMIMNGPSFQRKGFSVDEAIRSKTSQESKDKYGVWEDSDIESFKPERFLIKSGDGDVRFDPFAGPVLPYGAGLRGCFGIKLAILELRVIMTMIVWSFEMQAIIPELSSMKGLDVNTHRTDQLYLRLAELQ